MADRSRSDGMAFCLPAPSTGPRDPMRRKVTFTPDRYLRKIWQLGNYDVSPDGRLLAYSANKGEQWSVYVMELRTKREKPLLESDQSLVQPEFSPDGRWLAVQSDFEGDENYNSYVTPAAGGSARKVTDTRWDSASPRWSPDGKRIAFLSNRDGDRDNVFVVDTQGGEAKQLTNVDDIVTEIAWRPDGKSVAFSAGVGLHDYVGLVDLNGRLEKVVDFPESESSIGGDAGPPAPWSADGANLAFVSNVHDHLDIGVLDLRRRRVRWLVQSKWDRSRGAALITPHGGPESQTVNEWYIRPEFLVAQGFTVLAPNYRGGTGYGRAWRRLSDQDLGGADMEDIIAGGRWLVKNGYCAPDRLGAIGTSYGGYAVAHILEKAPDLWAVGVSVVGYFNWMTATTNERGYLQRYDRQKMGHPDTDADRFRKYSPIYFLDSIRAPVLFTGGAHDPRCPVTEARAMVEEMQKMGKTVDYLEFPDEGHSPRKMSNQIRLHERAIEWLTRYLRDA